jgi:hypothetical protein
MFPTFRQLTSLSATYMPKACARHTMPNLQWTHVVENRSTKYGSSCERAKFYGVRQPSRTSSLKVRGIKGLPCPTIWTS